MIKQDIDKLIDNKSLYVKIKSISHITFFYAVLLKTPKKIYYKTFNISGQLIYCDELNIDFLKSWTSLGYENFKTLYFTYRIFNE